jgi:hypothetical protein
MEDRQVMVRFYPERRNPNMPRWRRNTPVVPSGAAASICRLSDASSLIRPKGNFLAFAQPQLVTAVADRAKLSETDAKRALSALEEILLEEVLNAVKLRFTGLIRHALGVELPQSETQLGAAASGRPALAAKSESVDLPKGKATRSSAQKSRDRLAA